MSSLITSRLAQERKDWRKDHPHGFIAKPSTTRDAKGDVTTNLRVWDCKIPGKPDTPWAGGLYPLRLEFGHDYPAKPPRVAFPTGFFSSKRVSNRQGVLEHSERREGVETVRLHQANFGWSAGVAGFAEHVRSSAGRGVRSVATIESEVCQARQGTGEEIR